MAKLWGGRFSREPDEDFEQLNNSFAFDRRLLAVDIEGSRVHAQALFKSGVLEEAVHERIQRGLAKLSNRVGDQDFPREDELWQFEDVHSFVEAKLLEEIGEEALRLHTGRSRNDQVVTDLRLYVRQAISEVTVGIRALQGALLDLADAESEAVLPGYTHLQPAQPILFAHLLLAYFEMLERDADRLADCWKRVNLSPLGSGALAGSNFFLDRRWEAEALGFDGILRNSLDAVSDRDFVLEFLFATTALLSHLSRWSEDWILYGSAEFGFLEFGDSVTTGSSLLPQKKNPDALELIRSKAARNIGNLVELLTLLKGLPLAYNKDLQGDKQPLFSSIDTTLRCLKVMTRVLEDTSVNRSRMAEAASRGYLDATELADYLVERGMPFRQAHEAVGRAVLRAHKEGVPLKDLSLENYRTISSLFKPDLFEVLSAKRSVERKLTVGGTSPKMVREALAEARRRLQKASGPSANR